MNNFSPSTDTSVGTKRFTAQEVQLAYTLMAVEYMKTIKGKYGLVVGRLSAYKGSVPDENIDEISKVMATAQALEANEYVNYSGNGSPLRYASCYSPYAY